MARKTKLKAHDYMPRSGEAIVPEGFAIRLRTAGVREVRAAFDAVSCTDVYFVPEVLSLIRSTVVSGVTRSGSPYHDYSMMTIPEDAELAAWAYHQFGLDGMEAIRRLHPGDLFEYFAELNEEESDGDEPGQDGSGSAEDPA